MPADAQEHPRHSLSLDELGMTDGERLAHWRALRGGRGDRIRCGADDERRSLLREHADGSCHDTQLAWWPAGQWRRK